MMNAESMGRRTALIAVFAVILTAFSPFLALTGEAYAEEGGSDLSIYRYVPKLTVTTEDPANVEYIVWDFGDGTVLDGRWEYYIKQQNDGVALSEEIVSGIESYKALLAENGGSLWVTTHRYADVGTYTVTIAAINALGYVPEGGVAYDGVLSTDETGFDGGMFDDISKDITSPSDLTDSSFKAVAGSWCRINYTVEILGYPTITFDSKDGTPVDSIQVENGSEYGIAVKPEDPTREGFEFDGWYTDPDCSQPFDWSLKVEAPVTLYAGWTPVSAVEYDHIITFMDGDSVIGTQNTRNSVADSVNVVIDKVASKEGYTFLGWSPVKGSVSADYTDGSTVTVPSAGLTLYAVWQQIIPVDTVTVTVDGKEIVMENGKKVSDLDVPSKDGYVFDGWYSDEGLTVKVSDDTVLTDGMTLFSKFTEKEDSIPMEYIACLIGIILLFVGFRYNPVIAVIGAIIALVAGLDIADIMEVFR